MTALNESAAKGRLFIGKRSVLRRLRPTDLAAFQAYRQDPTVGAFQGWLPMSDADASEFLEEVACTALWPLDTWFQIGIAERESDLLIGDIGICVRADKTAELGFSMVRTSQGQGLASEAVQGAITLLFAQARVQRILAVTDARNHASVRLLERLAMHRVKTLPAQFRGEPCEEHHYELIRSAAWRTPMRGNVAVLHGLARSARSMAKMAECLKAAGYRVCNIDYPSRKYSVQQLAAAFVAPELARHFPRPEEPIHFVTHSMGGILVRQLAASRAIKTFGRVVMLSPPNNGSEVVDKLGRLKVFQIINGPAGSQLGTQPDALPRQLPGLASEVGIITGNRSINLLLSLMLPGENDGKVTVASAQLNGMQDFLVVPAAHPFIMNNETVIQQTLAFLATGVFMRPA